MNRPFAWISSLSAVALTGGALLLASLAGCEPPADKPDVSGLPPEFVELISQSKPTVVDCYATWCGPCQAQKPEFEEAERQFGSIATFVVVDVDEVPAMWEVYALEGIPTTIIFKDGQPVEQLVGVHTADQIGEAVTRATE